MANRIGRQDLLIHGKFQEYPNNEESLLTLISDNDIVNTVQFETLDKKQATGSPETNTYT